MMGDKSGGQVESTDQIAKMSENIKRMISDDEQVQCYNVLSAIGLHVTRLLLYCDTSNSNTCKIIMCTISHRHTNATQRNFTSSNDML